MALSLCMLPAMTSPKTPNNNGPTNHRPFSSNRSSWVFGVMVENCLTQSLTYTVTVTQQTPATVSSPALALHKTKTKPKMPRLLSTTPQC